ncbi:hypothetical protein [Halomonas sp. CSM-2]|uniref:hypothetical protein n=1 Tax=Halomonas sp. CSM-2 TaxID=1975722 RepID=UPI00111C22E7|nr:hypothetical protein [Halomonas sp. CSM-2]
MNMQFRKTNHLYLKANSLKEAEIVTPFQPENVILFQDDKVGTKPPRRYDFGKFCFTRRDSRVFYTPNPFNGIREVRVDPSSFRPERVHFIGSVISFLREQNGSENSILDKSAKILTFLKFVEDMLDQGEWPQNEHNALVCYKKYVEHLAHRARLAKGSKDAIATNGAFAYATIVRNLIQSAYNISQHEIERKVPSIRSSRNSSGKEPAAKCDRQEFVYVCLSIFEQLHEVILNRKPYPWRIDLLNAGIDKSFIWQGRVSKPGIYTDYYFRTNGQIKSLEEFTSMLESSGFTKTFDIVSFEGHGRSPRNSVEKNFRLKVAEINEINNNEERYNGQLQNLYDIATICFWYCFLAATGLNYSVAKNLQYGSEEYIPQRGYVFSGLKVRAGNKTVYAEFKKNFEKYFNKFIKLRSWAVSQLYKAPPPLWFFLFDDVETFKNNVRIVSLRKVRQINKNSYREIPSGTINSLKVMLVRYKIPVKIISASTLRKGVSFDFYKLSGGNTALVAQKLGNTFGTVQRAYSSVNAEDAYPELVDYYSKVIEKVKTTGHSVPGCIPIRIIEDAETDNLPVGNCINTNFVKPRKANQFGEGAPEPDCARSETCLFCEFFAIHADRSGLKKLLSFRELLPLIKERSGSVDRYISIFSPIEGRIEEILQHIKKAYPEKNDLLNEVSEEVLEGELDDFWEHHFNFLIELGYAK